MLRSDISEIFLFFLNQQISCYNFNRCKSQFKESFASLYRVVTTLCALNVTGSGMPCGITEADVLPRAMRLFLDGCI